MPLPRRHRAGIVVDLLLLHGLPLRDVRLGQLDLPLPLGAVVLPVRRAARREEVGLDRHARDGRLRGLQRRRGDRRRDGRGVPGAALWVLRQGAR